MLYFHFNTLGVTSCSTSQTTRGFAQAWEVNAIDSFKFAIHLSDPSTNIIQKKITYVTVYDDVEEEVIFRGRVYSISSSTDGFMEVTCEGPLSYLKDGVYRGPDITQGTHFMSAFSGWAFVDYNLFVDAKRQFYPNVNWISTGSADSAWNTGAIKEDLEVQGSDYYDFFFKVMEALGFDFTISRRGSAPYWQINVGLNIGYQSTTPITVGLNLKSLTKSSTDEDNGFYTTVFPMGGYCYDNKRLQLKEPGINNPLDNRPAAFADSIPGNQVAAGSSTGDTICSYIDNTKLVKKYGRIIKCVIFDNIVANSLSEKPAAKQKLYTAALDHAKKLSEPTFDFDISGYDLSKSGYPVDELVCGNYYEIIDPITNTHIVARLKAMTKYYEKPNEPDLTMEYYNFNKAGDTR